MGRELGSSEEFFRDELVWFVIHICMETAQAISLYSSLCLKLAKPPCFSYYVLCFFFYKIREQESKTGSSPRQLPGGRWGEGEVAQIMYTHVSKYKMIKIK
jgi:hypothetical protein